jgi:hypothetical protein
MKSVFSTLVLATVAHSAIEQLGRGKTDRRSVAGGSWLYRRGSGIVATSGLWREL